MSFMYDYMSEAELALEIKDKQNQNFLNKIGHEFECVIAEHKIRMADIEARVLFENCSEDDLTSAFKAEYLVYTEGVKEVWQKFVDWIVGIFNAIFKRKPKKDAMDAALKSAEEVEVPADPNMVIKVAGKICDVFKNLVNFETTDKTTGEKKFNTNKLLAEIGTAVGIVGAAGGIGAIVKKCSTPTKVKESDCPGLWTKLADFGKKIPELVKSLAGKMKDGTLNFIEGAIGQITALIDKVTTAISNIINKGKKSEDKTSNDDSKSDTNDNTTTSNDTSKNETSDKSDTSSNDADKGNTTSSDDTSKNEGGNTSSGGRTYSDNERYKLMNRFIGLGKQVGLIDRKVKKGTVLKKSEMEDILNKLKKDKRYANDSQLMQPLEEFLDNINESAILEFVSNGFVFDNEFIPFMESTDSYDNIINDLSDIESFGLDFGDIMESTTNTDSFTGLLKLVDEL